MNKRITKDEFCRKVSDGAAIIADAVFQIFAPLGWNAAEAIHEPELPLDVEDDKPEEEKAATAGSRPLPKKDYKPTGSFVRLYNIAQRLGRPTSYVNGLCEQLGITPQKVSDDFSVTNEEARKIVSIVEGARV